MGISRDSWHKRRNTGGKKKAIRKKRKYELGRPPANTKIGGKRIHTVRTRGGNQKFRALRLDSGNYSWGSESMFSFNFFLFVVTREYVPFFARFEAHYAVPLGRKKTSKAVESEESDVLNKKRSNHCQRKMDARKGPSKIDPHLEEQFTTGRLYACVASRPGQSGRCDGYILEGKELEFYVRKIKAKKAK
ncbi:40S ribosomal protein S8-like [Orbicella faveolata]|uniref:40S ribosomal protein S8-like n=1 Tax=Orbicella faveolata TaxID=48498 RepID=UPI0009E22A1F|nr:40S ribosomal protein S8-like [Orbicella faveolata]